MAAPAPPSRPLAPPAAASTDNVAEMVLLLTLSDDVDAECGSDWGRAREDRTAAAQLRPTLPRPATLDGLWSTQYLAPGALCAFAGATMSGGGGGFTHALHLRFPDPATASSFLAHPATAAATGALPPAALTTLLFPGRVAAATLESLFRRGGAWESGVERVLLLAQRADDDAAADAWLSDIASLAESAAAGALQATGGRLVGGPAAAGATHALLARFADKGLLDRFMQLPAVASMAGGERGEGGAPPPLAAVGGATFEIAPAQGVTRA